jgi:hypothetical protein
VKVTRKEAGEGGNAGVDAIAVLVNVGEGLDVGIDAVKVVLDVRDGVGR